MTIIFFLTTSLVIFPSRKRKEEGMRRNRRTIKRLLIIIVIYIFDGSCVWDDTRWSITMQTDNQLDISISLSTFFLKNVGVWMSDNSDEQRRMKMLFIYTIWMLFCGTIISTRDLYFTLLYNGVSMFNCFVSFTRIKFKIIAWFLKI